MNSIKPLQVTSHVGRDLLASANMFKNEAAAVWEYVVNSLQYVDDGVLPKIHIVVNPKEKFIEIRDNGRGMTHDDLARFFKMHDVNIDRARGRPGRGKFGTGKSAAFGIGSVLRVDTRRRGLRNTVELHRNDVEQSTGENINVRPITTDEATSFPNGTTITIEGIFLSKLNVSLIVEYIERHLQIYRSLMPEVAVNTHVCQYKEPPVVETHSFVPSTEQREMLGDCTLSIKVSAAPLPDIEQGVFITAGLGNLVAIETAGVNAKELGNYLFGDIDVPALETYTSKLEAYDQSRNLQLNPQHPVVQVLLPFVGARLEEVRKLQVAKLREAQKSEEARRLTEQADKIADILNDDFTKTLGKLHDIRSASARPGPANSNAGNTGRSEEQEGVWVEGIKDPGELAQPSNRVPNSADRDRLGRNAPDISKSGQPKQDGNTSIDPVSGAGDKKKKPRGGFSVAFRHLGEGLERSRYDRTSLAIIINLDHVVVRNASKMHGIEDINFKRLAYEIAFNEYAMAIGYNKLEQDPEIPADDLLYEIRTTLNRVSTSAAALYGAQFR